jgi:putative FmdB family regulatory protein
MPLYEYAPTSGQCDRCHGLFEVVQRIADDKLTNCPSCAQPCERRISAVALGGKYATNENAVKNAGLTQYKRAEKGVYERTVGTGGPEILYRN